MAQGRGHLMHREGTKMAELPLKGYLVVDFGAFVVGPLCSALLADMGAEVIKVESKARMEPMRRSGENITKDKEKDPWYHQLNRDKMCITVNIRHPKARELLLKLVKKADIVIENFSLEVMAKHGLDYQSLSAVKPDLIMMSFPSTGGPGPLKDVITQGNTLSALSGMDSMAGYRGEQVLGAQGWYCDWNSPVHGAFAILAALRYRNRTGRGQYIQMSQMEATITCLGPAVMEYIMTGRIPGTQGNYHPAMAPHNLYRCKGVDKWVSICVGTEDEWEALCRVMGNPAWTRDERFSDKFHRQANLKELDSNITEWTINFTDHEAMETLQRAGIAATAYFDTPARFLDPHFAERHVYAEVEHPVTGMEVVGGLPWKLSLTPGAIRQPAPLFGQHNDYVFRELLRMSDAEVSQMQEEQIIF